MSDQQTPTPQNEFARHGAMERASFFSEYIYFLKTNKKWWMLPLLVMLLAFGVLMVMASTGAAPFIYTLF
jgi:hypothetical protein